MGILASLKNLLTTPIFKGQQKTNSPGLKRFFELIPSYEVGMEQNTQFSYQSAALNGYDSVVWINRCVREIANRLTSVPWGVYTPIPNSHDEFQELPEHPLNLLLQTPNPFHTFADILEYWVIYLHVSGNAYMELGARKGGVPTTLYFLRPDRIQIIPSSSKTKIADYYKYTVGSESYNIPPKDIVHTKFLDPNNDYYGLSPIYVGRSIVDTENEAISWNKSMLANKARPGGFFSVEGTLSTDQKTYLKQVIQEQIQGPTNAYRPLLMEDGMKWVEAQFTPSDMEYLNSRKMNREEICAVFGVPPPIVGIMDRSTYNNMASAEQTFWNQTIIPLLIKFRDSFNRNVSLSYGENILIDYNLRYIKSLSESEESLHRRADSGFKGGYMTQNEARALVGLQDLPGGNFFLVPSGFNIIKSDETDVSKAVEKIEAEKVTAKKVDSKKEQDVAKEDTEKIPSADEEVKK